MLSLAVAPFFRGVGIISLHFYTKYPSTPSLQVGINDWLESSELVHFISPFRCRA
eukprot:c5576_g1_i1 orf=157-321(+)